MIQIRDLLARILQLMAEIVGHPIKDNDNEIRRLISRHSIICWFLIKYYMVVSLTDSVLSERHNWHAFKMHILFFKNKLTLCNKVFKCLRVCYYCAIQYIWINYNVLLNMIWACYIYKQSLNIFPNFCHFKRRLFKYFNLF